MPGLAASSLGDAVRKHVRVEPGSNGILLSGRIVYVDANFANDLNALVTQNLASNAEVNAALAYVIAHSAAHLATKSITRAVAYDHYDDTTLINGAFDSEVAHLLGDLGVSFPANAEIRNLLPRYDLRLPTAEAMNATAGRSAEDLIAEGVEFPVFGDSFERARMLPQATTPDLHLQPNRDLEADEFSLEIFDSLERMLSFGAGASASHRLFYFLTRPLVDAETLLRGFLKEKFPDNVDYELYHKAKLDEGIVAARTVRTDGDNRKGYGAVCIDTSGSISFEMISAYVTLIKQILEEQKIDLTLDLYHGDDGISEALTVRSGEIELLQEDFRPHGGGGTDFRPFFQVVAKRAEETSRVPDFCLYVTDMCGTFPEKDPGIPTIWMTTTESEILPQGEAGGAPFGTVAYIAGHLL